MNECMLDMEVRVDGSAYPIVLSFQYRKLMQPTGLPRDGAYWTPWMYMCDGSLVEKPQQPAPEPEQPKERSLMERLMHWGGLG